MKWGLGMKGEDALVLLVDDEPEVREGVARLLRSAGARVQAFASAEEALANLPTTGVGCLVLDVSMPGMSGPELHSQLRDRQVSFPVIYLTGRCDLPTGVQAMKWGALDVLEKPVDDLLLIESIATAIEQHRSACLSRSNQASIESRLATLSPREREVMDQVRQGLLNKQIADRLGISIKTVKVHRGRGMAKMCVRSAAEFVHLYDQLESRSH